MPFLTKLSISNLRNIGSASAEPSKGFNLIYGENGSGKTSLLESIYLLARGKTFRSSSKAPIIQDGAEESVVFTELDDGQTLGFCRSISGAQKNHINGEDASSKAELAQTLPLLMLNADAFKILEGGPSVRRAYLDWGVFHVEQNFLVHWRQAQRALQNRNSLLKNKTVKPDELSPWTHELCQHSLEVDRYRNDYALKLKTRLGAMLESLLPLENFSIEYYKGWDDELGLDAVLRRNMQRDVRMGHTSAGPHRADLKIKVGKNAAVDVLSRGQQKLLVIAMKLAQALVLKNDQAKECVFLVDDLPAELDSENKAKVIALLAQIGGQAFVTGIEKEQLLEPLDNVKELKLFHVEHGKIFAE